MAALRAPLVPSGAPAASAPESASRARQTRDPIGLLGAIYIIEGTGQHIVPALPTHAWGGNVRCLRSPGGLWAPGAKVTRATSHGGMDNDEGIREAVAQFIKAS